MSVAYKAMFIAQKVSMKDVLEKLMGSKGRVAILGLLFDGNDRHIHIGELARRNSLSIPSLMREAKSLVKLGLLREAKDGNRVDYSANVDSPLYGPLKELVKVCCGVESALALAFADSADLAVFIYGSRARGNARSDSDYDVFVIGHEGLRKTTARVAEVVDKLGVEVNPYVITPEELLRRMRDGNHFIKEVMASPKTFLRGDEDVLRRLA